MINETDKAKPREFRCCLSNGDSVLAILPMTDTLAIGCLPQLQGPNELVGAKCMRAAATGHRALQFPRWVVMGELGMG